MTWEHPFAGLAAFAAALVALLVLERLKRRPVVLVVAQLALFPETPEVQSAAARSRRREWRELVLKALAAAALAAALAAPFLEDAARTGRRLRVVLARGASLAAREPDGRSRLDHARVELRRALELLAPEDEVDLALAPRAGDEPSPGLRRDAALAALETVRPVAAPSSVEARLPVLAAAVSDLVRAPGRALPALVVSDREPEGLPPELARGLRVATVGSPLPNAAVVGFASRRDPEGEERLLVAVLNARDVPAEVSFSLRLALDPSELASAAALTSTVSLGPGEIGAAIVRDPRLGLANVAEVRLEGTDALALDDVALAVRDPDAPVRVAVSPELGAPVVTVLRAVPGTTVTVLPERSPPPTRGFDLFVLGWSELATPRGATVWVCPPEAGNEAPATGLVVTDDALRRSLAPGADLAAGLRGIARVRRDAPSGVKLWPAVVATGAGIPVIAARGLETREGLGVYLGFALPASVREDGWAADPSFPIFWASVVERARERPEEPAELVSHPTGSEVALPRPRDAVPLAPLTVRGPEGRETRAPGGRFAPRESGLHTVRAEGGTEVARFGAALLSPAESDLRGARARPFDEETLALLRARGGGRDRVPLSPLLAVLGLALAAAAWREGTRDARPLP